MEGGLVSGDLSSGLTILGAEGRVFSCGGLFERLGSFDTTVFLYRAKIEVHKF